MTFRHAPDAFNEAIASGRLSEAKAAPNYAGNYMYMGTTPEGRDLFKNIATRDYLP